MRHATSHTGTETHRGVDQMIEASLEKGSSANGDVANLYEEGFAASSGIRPATAETGGRIADPEITDEVRPATTQDKENAGLADS